MQAEKKTGAPAVRRVRVRYTNRMKCLLCYLICFLIPPAWQAGMFALVYPYKLAGTAPDLMHNLSLAFPFFTFPTGGGAQASAAASGTEALQAALSFQDGVWRAFTGLCFLCAWGLTLLAQLLWRVSYAKPVLAAKTTARAVRAYRLTQALIWLVNAWFALAVWFLGVRFIAGRTVWDYLFYFAAYVLNALAAFACFRLAAPPALSGRHAFFKRL